MLGIKWRLKYLELLSLLSKAGFPLGGILRAERNPSLSFLVSSTEKSQDKEKFRSARKIPPNGKPA